MPQPFLEWCKYCGESQSEDDLPAADLVNIVSRFMNVLNGSPEGIDPHALLQEALLCEADLEQWEQNLPPLWKFNKVKASGIKLKLYNDPVHVYRDLWTAKIWNHYRWVRSMY